MKLVPFRRRRIGELPGIVGTARIDHRTERLLQRLGPRDIAVIDVADLDRNTADALVGAQVAAVVNAQPSISGRYPNLGPEVLVSKGVPLLDNVGSGVFTEIRDGMSLRLDDDTILDGTRELAHGVRQDPELVAQAMTDAKEGMSSQLASFAARVQQYMLQEKPLLLDGEGIPEIATQFKGRQVVLVSRTFDYEQDLRGLKHYIHEYHPVLVGVGAGADVLAEAGYHVDLVVGDLNAVSEPTLSGAGELVDLAPAGTEPPGQERTQELRLSPVIFTGSATAEDAAMLLADAGEAALVVTVGIRATLEELLDAGRANMASTVLIRLKLGGRVVDAKALAQLYRSRVSGWSLLALVLAALIAVAVIVSINTTGDSNWQVLVDQWHRLADQVRSWFS